MDHMFKIFKSICVLFILLISQQLFSQQFPFSYWSNNSQQELAYVFYDKPVDLQLFQRESDDSATITIAGSITSSGTDSVYTEWYRNGTLIKRKNSYIGDVPAAFSITNRIRAELSEYKLLVYAKQNSTSELIYTADSLVCGDAYVIMGQSNAQAPDTNISYSNEFCRTFGIQTNNFNTVDYNAADTNWALASADWNSFVDLNSDFPNNVGAWGMELQKKIKETNSIPTCIINGSRYGTRIYEHWRKDSDPTAANTYYGKTLYRANKSGLTTKIKAIFWFQGELNIDSTVYASQFATLYTDWNLDYTALEKVFVFQIRPLACFGEATKGMEVREAQRTLPLTHAKVQILSTAGIPGYVSTAPSSYCHYEYTGYQWMATMVYRNVAQHFYNSSDTVECRPPNIRRAFYTNAAKTQIGLLFDNSNPVAAPADTSIISLVLPVTRSIKHSLYFNGSSDTISSMTLSSDTILLNLTSAGTASRISYVPPTNYSGDIYTYAGPWIRNSKGIGALTFHNILIYEYESTNLFERMATISSTRKILVDSLFKRLRANNVLEGDALYIFANSDTGAANLNWLTGRTDTYRALRNGTLTFTADKGYTGNGIDGYLNTQIIPSTLTYYQLDSGSVGVYSYNNILSTSLNSRPFGVRTTGSNSYLGMVLRSDYSSPDKFFINMNEAVTRLDVQNSNSAGLFIASRNSSTDVVVYKNGSSLYTSTVQTSAALSTIPIFICAYNQETVPSYFWSGRIAMFKIGGKMSNTQLANFTTDIEWYMTTVGASYTQ